MSWRIENIEYFSVKWSKFGLHDSEKRKMGKIQQLNFTHNTILV